MIDEPYVTQSETRTVAFIHVTVPREDIRFVMDPALRELKATLAGQGVKPIGPWFTHHLRIDPKAFDFNVCLPVSKEVVATGRVQAGRMFGTKVARTIYRGPYESLGDAWRELGSWIGESGFKTGDDLWECYLSGPEKSNDPAEWETELSRAIE
jgi:effector-binding domain-containing protein